MYGVGWCADNAHFSGMIALVAIERHARVRSAEAMSAILHNGVIEHLGRSEGGADASITTRYVNIAWGRVTAPALLSNAFTL